MNQLRSCWLVAVASLSISTSYIVDPDKETIQFKIQDNQPKSLSDLLGVPVMRLRNLTLETPFCERFYLVLFSRGNRAIDGSIRVGISSNFVTVTSCPDINTYSSCSKHITELVKKPVLTCGKMTVFWLGWDHSGYVALGLGQTFGNNILLEHDAKVRYPVRFINIKKSGPTPADFILTYDRENPVPHVLTLHIPEDTRPGTPIYSFPPTWECSLKAWLYYRRKFMKHAVAKAYKKKLILFKWLDHEETKTHTFSIRCMHESTYVNLTIWILVSDVNDNIPELVRVGQLVVLEELPLGSQVGPWVKATDKDLGDTLVYKLTGQHSNIFSIDKHTGDVSVAQRIDKEASKYLYFSLSVEDAAGHVVSANVTLRVIDINDNQPQFRRGMHRLDLSFSHRVTRLTTFHLSDGDDGKDKCNCKMKITTGNDDKIFSLKKTHLHAKLSDLMDLNLLERQDWQFLVTVTVWDRPTKGPTLNNTAFVFITVEKPPKYRTFPVIHYNFTTTEEGDKLKYKDMKVAETVPPMYDIIYTARYTTVDSRSVTIGQQEYHLRSDQNCPDGTGADAYFSINPKTGAVTVKRQLNADANGCTKYKMSFYISDYRQLTHIFFDRLSVTVRDVNDVAPIPIPRYVKTRLPCHPYPGHRVANFRFIDGDIGKSKFKVTITSKNTFKYATAAARGRVYIFIDKKEKPWTKSFRYDVIQLQISDGGRPPLSSQAFIVVESSDCWKKRKRRRRAAMVETLSDTKEQQEQPGNGLGIKRGNMSEEKHIFRQSSGVHDDRPPPCDVLVLYDVGVLAVLMLSLTISIVTNVIFISRKLNWK